MAQIVYTSTGADGQVPGDLFAGIRFFVAQRCPSRANYIDKVTSNGGIIVKLEKQADILIADDIKKHLNPNGAISFKFIDDSIKTGTLVDAEDIAYLAGPPTASSRPVGAVQPGKFGRTPFTLQDKIQLYEFVENSRRQGASVRGNEIYKQLERINDRHTFQAWRDHYIKNLEGKPHPDRGRSAIQQSSPPAPPVDRSPEPLFEHEQPADDEDLYEEPPQALPRRRPMTTGQAKYRRKDPPPPKVPSKRLRAAGFSADDVHDLLANAEDILDTRVRHEAAAWQAWADSASDGDGEPLTRFSPKQWKQFWQSIVQPLYETYEDDRRRTKIYHTSWLAWSQMNEGASADEWLDYFDLVVNPLLDNIDEQELGATTNRSSSSQRSERHASTNIDDDRDGQSADILSRPLPKRNLAQTDTDDTSTPSQSSNKRQRLQQSQSVGSHPNSAREDRLDINASIRKSTNILSDEAEQDQGEAALTSPSVPSPLLKRHQPNGRTSSPSPPSVRLSGHKRHGLHDTQAILDDSHSVDFNIPEPDEELDGEDLYPDLRNHRALTSPQPDSHGQDRAAHGLTASQADLDYDLPNPDGLDVSGDFAESESAPLTDHVPAPQDDWSNARNGADYPSLAERATMLNIEGLMAAGRNQEILLDAAMRTSADPQLFRVVLKSLENKRGVPRRTRGVWTEEDDEVVEGTDARKLQALERKHGTTGLHSIEGRLAFLREWRAPAE